MLRHEIEIYVVVSVRLYRDGITDALQQDRRFRVVGSTASLEVARDDVRALARPPDVTLLDVHLGEGVDAARFFRSAWPDTNIVALAVREVEEDVIAWVEAGACGLVSRDATLVELLDAVEAAASDELLCTPAVAATLLRRVASGAGGGAGPGAGMSTDDPRALTRREREIVRLIGDGLSNKEIATSLRIELATVKNHVHNILEKLRVDRRAKAVVVARARGELEPI